MEKYMKFPMFEKETKDKKYHEDPFRAVNFQIDDHGELQCPNGKSSYFPIGGPLRGTSTEYRKKYMSAKTVADAPMPGNVKRQIKKGHSGS